MKKLIAVFAILAGSVFFAAPAAMANGDVIDSTTETPTPTETPADPPTEEAPAEETPAEEAPAEEAPAETSPAPAAEKGLTEAKLVVIKAAKEKVTICHATASHNNPYVINKPAKSADVAGHDGHNGPIWFDGIDVEWGDIIPPFDYPGGSYPGQNWDAAGEAIFDNDCQFVDEVVEDVSAVVEDPEPATCEADGTWVAPEDTESVDYTLDPSPYTGPGEYTVTAEAKPGFFLVGPFEFEITVEEQLTGDECGEIDDEELDDNGLLPDTGGSSPWLFLGAASMIAGGVVLLRKKQGLPAVPGYRLDI